jgi:hypothetical protein
VDFEDALNGETWLDGRLGEPSRERGDECGERAEVKKADGGAVLVVIGAPDGESFKEKGSEPECDGKMDEERMDVEHGFQAGEHGSLLRGNGEILKEILGRCKATAPIS